MAAATDREPLQFRGLKRRGGVRGALLVLRGAKPAQLARAWALTARLAGPSILVAVDGGLSTCRAARRKPDLFVGDGDSARRIPTDVPAVVYPRHKDFSDLAGALREIRRRDVQIVAVLGMLGGRLDHEWANLLELGRFSRDFAGIVAPTERGTVIVTSGGCSVVTARARLFSLFSLSAAATITLRGARWELERGRIRPGSRGLSNVSGTEIELTVHAGTVALVLPPRAGTRG